MDTVPQPVEAEHLLEHFGHDRFDLVHSRNAIDHTYDALEAIRQMGKLQLNEDLDDQQVGNIASFLEALTDKNREQYLR